MASLSGTSRSFTMHDIDFAALETIATFPPADASSENKLAKLVTKLTKHPIYNNAFSHLSHEQLTHRFEQYIKSGAVLEKPCENPPSIHAIVLSDTLSNTELTIEQQSVFRLGTNLGININHDGYCVWSSVVNEFVLLSAIEASVLLAFGDGKSLSSVIASKQHLGISNENVTDFAQRCVSAGILVEPKQEIAGTEAVLTPFSTNTVNTNNVVKYWRDISASSKIPVYFVPHMENHFPLALGVLFSALSNHKNGALLEKFELIPLNYLSPNELFDGPYKKFGPGVWLFSNYMWSIDINMQISEFVKKHNSANYTVHGGPSTPDYRQACEDFLKQYKSVDIAVHGEGEVTINEIFECIDKASNGAVKCDAQKLSSVGGLTYREEISGRFIRTGDRERMKQPDEVPSPYLNGLFDQYNGRVEAAIIETNRGCPYGCTFCDWGSATNQKIRKFDLQRVKDEIEWIGKNHVRVMWIADANYGLYDRDIEISQFIVDTKAKYGYPQEIVVNYTKNSTWRLVEIIKIFSEGGIIGQGIISIQTTDENTLEVINRKNIRTQRYDELAQAFTDLNLPLSTDLMIGLPGMTVTSFLADLQRYFDMDVSVKAYPTQLLPNSPMADPDYIEKYQIKTDDNDFLVSTYSYTEEDRATMLGLYELYVMADGYSLLRYVMRYIQWEHRVSASTFLLNLLHDIKSTPDAFPLITWACRFFNKDKSMPGGWHSFYAQVEAYLQQRYSIASNSALNTILQMNNYAMPDDARVYPLTLKLNHDITAYFKQDSKEQRQPLSSFGSVTMTFSDPNRLSQLDLDAAQYDSHQYFWELHSDVARPKSLAEFAA